MTQAEQEILVAMANQLVRLAAWESLGIELHQDRLEELLEAIYREGKRDALEEAVTRLKQTD